MFALCLNWVIHFFLPSDMVLLVLSSLAQTGTDSIVPTLTYTHTHTHTHTHTSWAFGLGLGFRPLAPLVHRPLDLDWIMPPTLVFLQLMDSKSWDFWLSNILLVLFRWRTLTNMPYSPVYLIHTFYPHIIIYVALFYFQKYPGLGNKVFPDLGTITMHWFYSLQFLYEAKLITYPKTCLNFYFL